MSVQLINELDSIHKVLDEVNGRLLIVATELAEALKPSHNISVMPCPHHCNGHECFSSALDNCTLEPCTIQRARA
jgi:hypothetical protein